MDTRLGQLTCSANLALTASRVQVLVRQPHRQPTWHNSRFLIVIMVLFTEGSWMPLALSRTVWPRCAFGLLTQFKTHGIPFIDALLQLGPTLIVRSHDPNGFPKGWTVVLK